MRRERELGEGKEAERLRREVDRIRGELRDAKRRYEEAVLAEAREEYEGRALRIEGSGEVIDVRIRNVTNAVTDDGHSLRIDITGETMTHVPLTNGFPIEGSMRCESYTLDGYRYSLHLSPSKRVTPLTDEEWKAEASRARQIQSWLRDKAGKKVIRCEDVFFISEGSIMSGTAEAVDGETGEITVECSGGGTERMMASELIAS